MTLVADFNSSVNVPFQRMRQLLLEQGGGIQEGVVGANDLKVAQRGAGANMSVDVSAGAAWVQIDTGTRNGLGHVYNDATANVVVSASNATNPRIDQIILRWNDTSIPTGSGNVPTLEVLTGTATAGATLDNRTGATALPNDCLRLADFLVPATSTSVTTANIRDRRLWARGAYWQTKITAGTYTTASTSMVDIDATNLKPRIECSGVPLRVSLQSYTFNTGINTNTFRCFLDGATIHGPRYQVTVAAASGSLPASFLFTDAPTAGSHLVALQWMVSASTGSLAAGTNDPLVMTVEEIVRSNVANT